MNAIFWKEFRQQFPLWISLIIVVFVMSVAVTLGSFVRGEHINSGGYAVIAVVTTLLYTVGSSAVVFCNEHESKTYLFLRSLPVSRRAVFVGKILWIFSSIFAFLIVAFIIAGVFEVCFGDFRGIDLSEAYTTPKAAVIATLMYFFLPISFGIFWSTLTKSQLNSVLFTFASIFGCVWPGVAVAAYVRNSYGFEIDNYIYAAMYFSVVVVLFSGIAIYNGLHWFDIWKDKQKIFSIFQKENFASTQDVAVAMSKHSPWKGEFFSLVRHAFKQSRILFIYTLCIGLLSELMLIYYLLKAQNSFIASDVDAVFWIVVCGSAFAFCGSVFSGDQKSTGAFFSERGISPGKVWWSRIVAFGSVYFGIILFITATVFVIVLAHHDWGRNLQWANDDIIRMSMPLICYVGLIISLFCIGQFVSLLIRSGVVSIVMTGIMTWCFIMWGTFMLFYLGNMMGTAEESASMTLFVMLWSTASIIVATVIASRLRITDWLRQRPIRKSRRPVGSVIFATIFVICVLIPLWRIYTVPVIDYGYHVDKAVLEKKITLNDPKFEETDPSYWYLNTHTMPIERLSEVYDKINKSFVDPDQAIVATHYFNIEWLTVRSLKNTIPYKQEQINEHEPNVTRSTNIVLLNELKPEVLDAGIEMLEKLDKNRVPLSTRLQRVYETDYRLAKYGILFDWYQEKDKENPVHTTLRILKYVPWEKTRLLRRLDYQFQFRSRMADQVENAFNSRSGNCGDLLIELQRQNRNNELALSGDYLILQNFSLTYSILLVGPRFMYDSENNRRMTLIYFALLKYRKEKGELPSKLDDLKTAGYLSEIPKVPGYNFDYYYDPNPTGTEPSGQYHDRHKAGVPYIWSCGMQPPSETPTHDGGCWMDINVE